MLKKFRNSSAAKATKGILSKVFNSGMDALPLPDPRRYLDKDQNGKFTLADLKHFKWWEFVLSIGWIALLLYFEIIDLEQLQSLIINLLTL